MEEAASAKSDPPGGSVRVSRTARPGVRRGLGRGQIRAFEAELGHLDTHIAELRERAHWEQLDVARAVREAEPIIAAWRDVLRGNPVRARQVLRKLVIEPIRMEPMPETHGYRWHGKSNGGAVLEGSQKVQ